MQGKAATLLRERRLELGLTQHEVAVRAGIRDYDVSRWERGATKTLPLLGAWKICAVLGIDLDVLADALLADAPRVEPGSSSPASPIRGSADVAAVRAARPARAVPPGRAKPARPRDA